MANSQQIENNLMASSASTASSLEKGQWEERTQAKTENDNLKKKPPKPPVPARMGTASNKHCITHHQRKQPLKQQSPGNGGHANDITEDFSDSDLEEPLLIYKQLNPCSLNNLKWYPTLKTKTKILPSQFLLLTNYNPQKMHSDVTHIMNKPKINKKIPKKKSWKFSLHFDDFFDQKKKKTWKFFREIDNFFDQT